MTKFNLFLELTGIINDLLEAGMTADNLYQARRQMDKCFDQFEELDGLKEYQTVEAKLGTFIDQITINILKMPKDLKDYFNLIESFKNENEIYPHDLPSFDNSIEASQLISDASNILNELLQAGVTACNAHEAWIKLDALFKEFEQQAEANEEMASADDDTEALYHLFSNIDIDELTIFTYRKRGGFNES